MEKSEEWKAIALAGEAERNTLHKILDDGNAIMAGSLAERISDVVTDRDAAIAERDAARAEIERLREQAAVLRVALLAQKTTDDLYYSTYAISVSDTAWRDYSEAKEFAKSKMDAALKATE